jgi:hypothetical protein
MGNVHLKWAFSEAAVLLVSQPSHSSHGQDKLAETVRREEAGISIPHVKTMYVCLLDATGQVSCTVTSRPTEGAARATFMRD